MTSRGSRWRSCWRNGERASVGGGGAGKGASWWEKGELNDLSRIVSRSLVEETEPNQVPTVDRGLPGRRTA